MVGSEQIKILQFSLADLPLLKAFVDLPWQLHRHDPHFIPRLNAEYLGNSLLGMVGLFQEEHPFHHQADTIFFLAQINGKVVGRVAAAIDREANGYRNERHGTFGFFECIDHVEVARALLSRAVSWCRQKGAERVLGPLNFSLKQTSGLLVQGFDDPPMVEMPYNPPYYAALIEAAGFTKEKDLLSLSTPYTFTDDDRQETLDSVGAKIAQRHEITIRPLNMKRLREDIGTFVTIFNQAWRDNWGFVPVNQEEAEWTADALKMILEPRLFLFAEINNEVVAVCGTLPDLNWALTLDRHLLAHHDFYRIAKLLWKKRQIPRARMMFFGIREDYRRKGLETLLLAESMRVGREVGFTQAEVGWILEDNTMMLRLCERMQTACNKIYRIYAQSTLNGRS